MKASIRVPAACAFVFASAPLLAACGGSESSSPQSNSGAACSFTSAIPDPPAAADANASLQQRAEAEQLVVLEGAIGRYLRGDVAVYRGTLQATSTTALNAISGPDHADTELPEGPVIASLEERPAWSGDFEPSQTQLAGQSAVLSVHSAVDQRYLFFDQFAAAEGVTWASGIAGSDWTTYLDAHCDGCAPSFWGSPSSLTLDGLAASGSVSAYEGVVNQGGQQVDVPVSTHASAELTLVAPCDLSVDDLKLADSGLVGIQPLPTLAAFTRAGNELVYHAEGSLETAASPCPNYTQYTIDLYIELHDLAHYGVRNFELGQTMQQCPA